MPAPYIIRQRNTNECAVVHFLDNNQTTIVWKPIEHATQFGTRDEADHALFRLQELFDDMPLEIVPQD